MTGKTTKTPAPPATETEAPATETYRPKQQTADDSSSEELGASFAQTNPPDQQ
jgi:hypothetical protein